jgi:hypothetical protein
MTSREGLKHLARSVRDPLIRELCCQVRVPVNIVAPIFGIAPRGLRSRFYEQRISAIGDRRFNMVIG